MSKPSGKRGGARAGAPKRRKKTIRISQRARASEGTVNKMWRFDFLEHLAETSNVSKSAAYAGISPTRAYKVRREDPEFASEWRAALLEGYEHLELEVLGYLRSAEPDRKMDIAGALKLLALHAQTVARERALRDDDDEQAVFDSIDKFIDDMRERRAVNAAILIAPEQADGEE